MKAQIILLAFVNAINAELISSRLNTGAVGSVAPYSTARWCNSTLLMTSTSACAPITTTETVTSTVYITVPLSSQECQVSTVSVYASSNPQPPPGAGAAVTTPATFIFHVDDDNSTSFLNGIPPTDATLVFASEPTTIVVTPVHAEDYTGTTTLTSSIHVTITRKVSRLSSLSTIDTEGKQQSATTSSSSIYGVATVTAASRFQSSLGALTTMPLTFGNNSSSSPSLDINSTKFLTITSSMVRFLTLQRHWNATSTGISVVEGTAACGISSTNATEPATSKAAKTIIPTTIVHSNHNHSDTLHKNYHNQTETSTTSTSVEIAFGKANTTLTGDKTRDTLVTTIGWNCTFTATPASASTPSGMNSTAVPRPVIGSHTSSNTTIMLSSSNDFTSSAWYRQTLLKTSVSSPLTLHYSFSSAIHSVPTRTISTADHPLLSIAFSNTPSQSSPSLTLALLSVLTSSTFPHSSLHLLSSQSVSSNLASSTIPTTSQIPSSVKTSSSAVLVSTSSASFGESPITASAVIPTRASLQSASSIAVVSFSSNTGKEDFDQFPVMPTFLTRSTTAVLPEQITTVINDASDVPAFRILAVHA